MATTMTLAASRSCPNMKPDFTGLSPGFHLLETLDPDYVDDENEA
jgi:hypothetical protein